ncbi:MAG: twin-arginine translocase subunit TatB [Sphingomonadaceae bacterium]|nr:twin-arginine translocase subunit TatB [Sphingomonadaceae bacterium]
MFDIGAAELLLVAMVALIVIGPKDLPLAMRTAGKWIGQLRGMTQHFRGGIDAIIREAEIGEQEKAWAEKNAAIMKEHPQAEPDPDSVAAEDVAAEAGAAPESNEASPAAESGTQNKPRYEEPGLFDTPSEKNDGAAETKK